jgi:hypothetical protein
MGGAMTRQYGPNMGERSREEYLYTPSRLDFKAGVPYKLQIQNMGTVKNYFKEISAGWSFSTLWLMPFGKSSIILNT